MSGHDVKRPEAEQFDPSRLGVIYKALPIVGVLCILASLLIFAFEKHAAARFGHSYLFAFMVCFTICGGSLFWTLIHHAMDANWTVVVRRIPETIISLFPYIAIAFIPIWFMAPDIFGWWNKAPGLDHVLDLKRAYLNPEWFTVRAIVYLVLLSIWGYMLYAISVRQDESGDPNDSIKMRTLSYSGIIVMGLGISFAGIDWMMSLAYHWFSTMFGVYVFAGCALSSMAVLILVSNTLYRIGYLKEVLSVEHNHTMGKFLLAFTIFWAYIGFSQYMLIYYANIPEETIWFMHRNEGGWYYYSIFLVVGHFIIPFLWLLTQPAKRHSTRLMIIAGWILVMHIVDLYWVIMPQFEQFLYKKGYWDKADVMGIPFSYIDILLPVGLLCIFAYLFIRKYAQNNTFPLRDPRLYESVIYQN